MTTLEFPGLPPAVDSWASHSRITPQPETMADARVAMHRAVTAAVTVSRTPRARTLVRRLRLRPAAWSTLVHGPGRHPIRIGVLAAASGVSIVVGTGWNAAAGSPFHDVLVAREQVSLVFASGVTALDLRLSYAEDRMRDARDGVDASGSLAEAATLLGDARSLLPIGHANGLWARWQRDETELTGLQEDVRGDGDGPSDRGSPSAPVDDHSGSGRGESRGATAPSAQSGGSGDGGSASGGSGRHDSQSGANAVVPGDSGTSGGSPETTPGVSDGGSDDSSGSGH